MSTTLKLILLQQQHQLPARIIHINKRTSLMHAIIDRQLLLIAKGCSDVRLHLVVEGSWGVVQCLYIVSLLYFIT